MNMEIPGPIIEGEFTVVGEFTVPQPGNGCIELTRNHFAVVLGTVIALSIVGSILWIASTHSNGSAALSPSAGPSSPTEDMILPTAIVVHGPNAPDGCVVITMPDIFQARAPTEYKGNIDAFREHPEWFEYSGHEDFPSGGVTWKNDIFCIPEPTTTPTPPILPTPTPTQDLQHVSPSWLSAQPNCVIRTGGSVYLIENGQLRKTQPNAIQDRTLSYIGMGEKDGKVFQAWCKEK